MYMVRSLSIVGFTQIYRFNPNQNANGFGNLENEFYKVTQIRKGRRIAKTTLEKKNKVEGLKLLDFQIY